MVTEIDLQQLTLDDQLEAKNTNPNKAKNNSIPKVTSDKRRTISVVDLEQDTSKNVQPENKTVLKYLRNQSFIVKVITGPCNSSLFIINRLKCFDKLFSNY